MSSGELYLFYRFKSECRRVLRACLCDLMGCHLNKHQHWCGVHGIFRLRAPPVLVFPRFIALCNLRPNAAR